MTDLSTFVTDFIRQGNFSQKALWQAKRAWSKKYAVPLVRNSDLLQTYERIVKSRPALRSAKFRHLIHLHQVRTLSGVAPVAVMTKPYPCPGRCVYCPQENGMPKSYLSNEPAVMRAIAAGFDPYLQVQRRLKQYLLTGHRPEKIELIVMGGSFSAFPDSYQIDFIARCFKAANEFILNKKLKIRNNNDKLKFKDLLLQQKKNETARYRIIGLTLETRPDLIDDKEIRLMRRLGCTRVEIGVQTTESNILKKIRRGHSVYDVVRATFLLKNAGFKICYHLMPNLPGSNRKMDLSVFKQVYTDPRFKPDMVKIYPCVVTKDTVLYDWYHTHQYQTYRDPQLIDLLVQIKRLTPHWVRINRLYRDIPAGSIIAGSKLSNLRQVVQTELTKQGRHCRCIRCREAKSLELRTKDLELKMTKYRASGGEEIFMECIDRNDRLYALLRLRLPSKEKPVFPVLTNSVIVRELHTFGPALAIRDNKRKATQHQGLGKLLLGKAAQVAAAKGYAKICVIAGVGSREYYRKHGYDLIQNYMCKTLTEL